MSENMIENMLDANENIRWRGKPERVTYIIGSPVIYLFAIFWAAIDSTLIVSWFSQGVQSPFFVFFILLHMTPVWFALLGPVYRAINWNYIDYVMTEKRIYIHSGIIGRDIKVIEFAEIREPSVNVGLIEKIRNCGTIRLSPYTDSSNNRRTTSYTGTLRHVEDPYILYKTIKQMALDIRTDVSYPNAMRPEINPGYNTRYAPKENGNDNKDGLL